MRCARQPIAERISSAYLSSSARDTFRKLRTRRTSTWRSRFRDPPREYLQKLAADLRVVVIAPIFERRAAGVYHNTACVIDADGSLCGHYRKMHIPDDPLFYEKFYFAPETRASAASTPRPDGSQS